MNGLRGRVAFVTNASSQHGRSVALSLARQGVQIAAFDRWTGDSAGGSTLKLQQLKREVEQMGVRCLTVYGDVMRETDVMLAVAEAFVELRRIDILFNYAKMQTDVELTGLDPEEVSFRKLWLAARYIIPRMVVRGEGTVITCAADVSAIQRGGWTLFNASNPFGHPEYANIRISAICPATRSAADDRLRGHGWQPIQPYPEADLVNAVSALVAGNLNLSNTTRASGRA